MENEPFILKTEIGEIRIHGVRVANSSEEKSFDKMTPEYPGEDLADTIARLLLENGRMNRPKE